MPYAADLTHVMGIGSHVGEVREAPNGQLYEWVEGVDGLGNPIGFWRQIRKAAGSLISRIPGVGRIKNIAQPFCQALPQLQSCIQSVPAAEPAYRMATRVCGGLRQVGLAGTGLMEAPDGQLYEVVEGIGAAGERRRTLRRVRLIIPAYIGSGRRRRVAAPTTAAPTATAGRVAFYS